MKRLCVLFLVIISLSFTGCYYEDGPVISLRTPESRLVNKWKFQKVTINGLDRTSDYSHGYVEFSKDNSSTFYIDTAFQYNASWEFSDDYKTLSLDCIFIDSLGTDSTWSNDYYILKLRDKEMWMESEDGNVTTYIELIQY